MVFSSSLIIVWSLFLFFFLTSKCLKRAVLSLFLLSQSSDDGLASTFVTLLKLVLLTQEFAPANSCAWSCSYWIYSVAIL